MSAHRILFASLVITL